MPEPFRIVDLGVPRKQKLQQVPEPLQGVRVDEVITRAHVGVGDLEINGPVLAALDPRRPTAGVLEVDAVGWVPWRGHWGTTLHHGLSRWTEKHATPYAEPYLDVRSGLDLDMSPAGIVQPGLGGLEVMGGPRLALHHFNGPWPLLRLTFTTRRPRGRGFVTLGVLEAADLRDMVDRWLHDGLTPG